MRSGGREMHECMNDQSTANNFHSFVYGSWKPLIHIERAEHTKKNLYDYCYFMNLEEITDAEPAQDSQHTQHTDDYFGDNKNECGWQ